MKIAFFSESYKPYISGVTNSIETLKNGLTELGHSALVLSPGYPGKEETPDTLRFPSIPAPYPGYRITLPVPGMYFKELKFQKIDIIHSHSPYQLGLLSLYYARKLKVPYVFTMHTVLGKYMHYVPLIPQKLSGFLTNKYISWFCNQCSCVIVPTLKVKEYLLSINVRKRIEVVPTGIDLLFAQKADPSGIKENYGIPPNAKVLIFVGRLAKEKNLDFLLDAFENIQKRSANTYLLIAAGGPAEKRLKTRAPKNVIFAGAIGYPKVFDYYAASDIFVFSSLTETQGLVLVEAMACGLPQVAVDAEGVSNVVKDKETGFLAKLSIKEFSDRVMEILNNEILHEKMSLASIAAARNDYSKETFARKIEQIYKSVI